MALFNVKGTELTQAYNKKGKIIKEGYNYKEESVYSDSSKKYSINNITDSYFKTAVSNIAQKINSLSEEDWESFIFITDPHGNGNQQKSQAIALYLLDNTNISMIVLGGDYYLNYWGQYDNQFENYMDSLKGNKNIYALFGNHETYNKGTYSNKYYLYNYFLKDKTWLKGQPEKLYYYFDDNNKKIRYIFLNTSDCTQYVMTSKQIDWLRNTASSLPNSNWSLLVFGHVNLDTFDIISEDMIESTELNASDIISAINQCNGTIIGYICGHQHIDMTKKVGNFQHTTLQCDKFETTNYYPGISFIDRSIGNETEQAVSIISINQETGQVIIRRIGAARANNTRIDEEIDNSIIMSYSYTKK